MKFSFLLIFLFAISLLLSLPSSPAVAGTPAADFEYQLGLYRQHFAEYGVFKQDYQDNPTLNNQQKALLSAKNTITSREATRIAYARILEEYIKKQNINHPVVQSALTHIGEDIAYYTNNQNKSKNITSADELSSFTNDYLISSPAHHTSLISSMLVGKVSRLIRYQIDAKEFYDTLVPKLPTPHSVITKNGLAQIATLSQEINNRLEKLLKISTEIENETYDMTSFYEQSNSELNRIRDLQLHLVNLLIEIETEYVNSTN